MSENGSQLPLAVELAELATQMSPPLVTANAVDRAVTILTALALETTPGACAAGITLVEPDGDQTSLAATAQIAVTADELQYELGEGPCLTALSEQAPVAVRDLTTETRWPRWTPAALALGLRSSLTVPLVAGERVLGAVKVYGDHPGAFDGTTLHVLSGFAETAAVLLASAASTTRGQQLSDGLRQVLRARDAVQIARGIVMQREGLNGDDAFQVLVGQARTTSRVLGEVAADIIRGVGGPTGGGVDA